MNSKKNRKFDTTQIKTINILKINFHVFRMQ